MNFARILGLLCSLALLSCKAKPASLQVEPDTIRFSAAGETVILLASVLDEKGTAIEHEPCLYVSTDAGVAEVKLDGTVTAVGGGRTDVRVTCSGLTKVIPVKVRLPHSVKLDVDCAKRCALQSSDPLSFKLEGLGAQASLKAKVLDEDGDPLQAEVRFEVRDPDFHSGVRKLGVEVSQDGRISARGVGSFLVLAHSGGAVSKASVEVVLPVVDVVKPEKGSVWLKPGEEAQLGARTYQRGHKGLREVEGARLAWQSSNKDVAVVDDDGRVKAVSKGFADIVVAADSGAFAQIGVRVDSSDKPSAKDLKRSKKKPARSAKRKGRGR